MKTLYNFGLNLSQMLRLFRLSKNYYKENWKKNSKLINQMFLKWKKIKMGMLFSLAEIEIIQSNNRAFKIFATNQSESSFNYNETFIFSYINQSELSFNSHGTFNKLNVNQSEN